MRGFFPGPGYPPKVSTLADKPARLARNRHGTYTFRWIVPEHLRERVGVRREIRVSLRTKDSGRARILALELNLELERLRVAMSQNATDLRHLIAPLGLELPGGIKADIKTPEDMRLFQEFLDRNGLRDELLAAIRRGEDPSRAVAHLVQKLGDAGSTAGKRRKLLVEAIQEFANSAETRSAAKVKLGARSTAGEKLRPLTLLLEHMLAGGADRETLHVHDILRSDVKAFVDAYAKRPSKKALVAQATRKQKQEEAKAAGVTAEIPPSEAELETLHARTVKKAIGHLEAFFVQALSCSAKQVAEKHCVV